MGCAFSFGGEVPHGARPSLPLRRSSLIGVPFGFAQGRLSTAWDRLSDDPASLRMTGTLRMTQTLRMTAMKMGVGDDSV